MLILAGLACGFLFGLGLLISGLALPSKVLAFLDIFGTWDASLAVVMGAALSVTAAGFAIARTVRHPLLATQWHWPSKRDIDAPLLAGSALFGIGWGLVGLCPGPALVNIASLSPKILVFVLAMAAGMGLHTLWQRRSRVDGRR